MEALGLGKKMGPGKMTQRHGADLHGAMDNAAGQGADLLGAMAGRR